MMDENQRKQAEIGQQLDSALVSTVTEAVLQTLQATGNLPVDNQVKDRSKHEPKTIDLIGLFFHIIERFWFVLISAVLCAILMGILAGESVVTYSATSKLYIVNSKSAGLNITDLQLGTVLTLDYQEVFKTWEVHELVIDDLELPYTYSEMQSMLTITNPEDTRILYITVTYPDAKMAADIANSYARAAKQFIINTMRGEEPSSFSIALEPSVGRSVSRSNRIIIGFMLGSVLAVGLLTLFFVLDDRPRSPEGIRQYGGIPTLAVFPSSGIGSKNYVTTKEDDAARPPQGVNYLEISRFPKLDFVCREAINTLCTNLSYCGKGVKKIMITSRYAGEGKSYVSMNLLRTFSQLGRTTVLVDTDLRASGIQLDYQLRYFKKNRYGLSEYLSGICELDEILYQTNLPNSYIIPAGHEAPNPLQLLDTKTMEELVEFLAERFDIVLLDTPPVGVLIDAVATAKYCDGALIVVGYQKGKQQEIGDAVDNIMQTGCKLLGAVLNGVKFNTMSNRYYYYNSERYNGNYNQRYYERKKNSRR